MIKLRSKSTAGVKGFVFSGKISVMLSGMVVSCVHHRLFMMLKVHAVLVLLFLNKSEERQYRKIVSFVFIFMASMNL